MPLSAQCPERSSNSLDTFTQICLACHEALLLQIILPKSEAFACAHVGVHVVILHGQ